MEDLVPSRFQGIYSTVRKKRSQISHRPRSESQPSFETCDIWSTPPSDDISKVSSDENTDGHPSPQRKESSLNECAAGSPEDRVKTTTKDAGLDEIYANSNFQDSLKTVPDGSDHKGTMAVGVGVSIDALGNESKLKKLKLKVGGVTRTIDANSSARSSRGSDAALHRQKGSSDRDRSSSSDKKGHLQGVPWKDFSRGGFTIGKADSSMGRRMGKNQNGNQEDKSDPMRKSKRVPKRRKVDVFDDDEEEDDEMRYLEKVRNSRIAPGFRDTDEEELSKNLQRLSKVSEDTNYQEDEKLASDVEAEGRKKKKPRKEGVDSVIEPRLEMTLTTRQKALLSGKDASTSVGSSIEFPNGLPPAPPRKQKEKLSEVEQQLKKAEAAERRRMQNEKAARETEAEAIRKILGQDSSRKKRGEKKKKREEELAQEKAADERMRASNSIRLVMGPNGTTLTFPNDIGLPSIFDPRPYRYPPPREKCAGPSCGNPYKYRDSKTKLPLCSLQCYKALHSNPPPSEATCS